MMVDPGTYAAAGWILFGLASLAFAIDKVLKVTDRLKEKPSPMETYTTKEACRLLHSGQDLRLGKLECEVSAIRQEVKEGNAEMDRKDEARSVAIHNRTNEILAVASRTQGEIAMINNILVTIQERLNQAGKKS